MLSKQYSARSLLAGPLKCDEVFLEGGSGGVAATILRDAEMTIKINFERSSQKGGRQRVLKEGQQGTHLEILLSA